LVVEYDGGAIVQERGIAHVESGVLQLSDRTNRTAVGELHIVEREIPPVDSKDRAAPMAVFDYDVCSMSERDTCRDARPIWSGGVSKCGVGQG
jgi:hypothetical protein